MNIVKIIILLILISLKTNLVYGNFVKGITHLNKRPDAESKAIDGTLCALYPAVFLSTFIPAKIASAALCRSIMISSNPIGGGFAASMTCPPLSNKAASIAAKAATIAKYGIEKAIANSYGDSTKVINTTDFGMLIEGGKNANGNYKRLCKTQASKAFPQKDGTNYDLIVDLNSAYNFQQKRTDKINSSYNNNQSVYDYKTDNESGDDENQYNWQNTGPLHYYCYHPSLDSSTEYEKVITNIGGEQYLDFKYTASGEKIKSKIHNKIGLARIHKKSEIEDVIWLDANSCNNLGGKYTCAWQENGKICAQGVYCTGSKIPMIGVVEGNINSADSGATTKRSCGTIEGMDDDKYVDDYGLGKCSDCLCCDGSKEAGNYKSYCSDYNKNSSCKTTNIERSWSNCTSIHSTSIKQKKTNLLATKAMSKYCSVRNNSVINFSFIGRAVRCVEKTLNNVFYGKEDYLFPEKAIQGKQQEVRQRCLNNDPVDADGNCPQGFFNKIQKAVSNVLTFALILFIMFIGFSMLIAGGIDRKKFMVSVLQFSAVIYLSAVISDLNLSLHYIHNFLLYYLVGYSNQI